MTRHARAAAIAWNGAGAVLPMVAALLAVSVLVGCYGAAGFGMLTVAWGILGQLTVLDLGIAHALSLQVCRDLGAGRRSSAIVLSCTALAALLGAGFGACLYLVAGPVARFFAPGDAAAVALLVPGLQMLAVGLPFAIVYSVLSGVFEAHEEFSALNLVRSAQSLATHGLAVVLALRGEPVTAVVAATVAVRVASCLLLLLLCWRMGHFSLHHWRPEAAALRALLESGRWMFLNNLSAQLAYQADRLVVARCAGLEAAGLYAVAAEIAGKISFVGGSVVNAYYPAMSKCAGTPALPGLVQACVRVASLCVLVAVVAAALALPAALPLWLPALPYEDIAAASQLLLLALVLNAPARAWVAGLQALGHARRVALVNMLGMPLRLLALFALASAHGAWGGGLSSLLANAADAAVLGWLWRSAAARPGSSSTSAASLGQVAK